MWFALRAIAALATVRAADAWIVRLDVAWQLVAIAGVAGAAAVLGTLAPATEASARCSRC